MYENVQDSKSGVSIKDCKCVPSKKDELYPLSITIKNMVFLLILHFWLIQESIWKFKWCCFKLKPFKGLLWLWDIVNLKCQVKVFLKIHVQQNIKNKIQLQTFCKQSFEI